MAVSARLCLPWPPSQRCGTTTEKEHPKQEAKAEAAERARGAGRCRRERRAAPSAIPVAEDEYSIKLPQRRFIAPGRHTASRSANTARSSTTWRSRARAANERRR